MKLWSVERPLNTSDPDNGFLLELSPLLNPRSGSGASNCFSLEIGRSVLFYRHDVVPYIDGQPNDSLRIHDMLLRRRAPLADGGYGPPKKKEAAGEDAMTRDGGSRCTTTAYGGKRRNAIILVGDPVCKSYIKFGEIT